MAGCQRGRHQNLPSSPDYNGLDMQRLFGEGTGTMVRQ